jgi:hypothetical protein
MKQNSFVEHIITVRKEVPSIPLPLSLIPYFMLFKLPLFGFFFALVLFALTLTDVWTFNLYLMVLLFVRVRACKIEKGGLVGWDNHP